MFQEFNVFIERSGSGVILYSGSRCETSHFAVHRTSKILELADSLDYFPDPHYIDENYKYTIPSYFFLGDS